MRARLFEIAGGLLVGLVLLASSAGTTLVIGRLAGGLAVKDAPGAASREVAR